MILLDTHVLIWAVADDDRLGLEAGANIRESAARDGVLVSAITPWEIAMLVGKGRLALDRPIDAWIEETFGLPGVRLAPITPRIAVESVGLPGQFHADPADRLIVATARVSGAALLTADQAILSYASNGHLHARDARR